MDIVYSHKKEIFNEFIARQKHSLFLQSWEWADLKYQSGAKIKRIGISEKGNLVSSASLVEAKLPLGASYWYCPGGPVFTEAVNIKPELAYECFDLIAGELSKNKITVFMRFEPRLEMLSQKFKINKTIDIQPKKTVILDLSLTEDELLAAMHQKTRYNIRLAGRKGVEIKTDGIDFSDIWKLYQETSERDRFRLHDRRHYKRMAGYDNNFIKVIGAYIQDKLIAVNFFTFFGDTATYLHGASANAERNVMAPYLLQWQAIKLAKSLGCRYYDFYGIDEHKWPGVTRFKLGFGGEIYESPGTHDAIFRPAAYKLYKAFRALRRMG